MSHLHACIHGTDGSRGNVKGSVITPRLGACSQRAAVTEESGRGGQESCNAISSALSDGYAANGSDGVRM